MIDDMFSNASTLVAYRQSTNIIVLSLCKNCSVITQIIAK